MPLPGAPRTDSHADRANCAGETILLAGRKARSPFSPYGGWSHRAPPHPSHTFLAAESAVRSFKIAFSRLLHCLSQQENLCGILAVRDEPVLRCQWGENGHVTGRKNDRDFHADHLLRQPPQLESDGTILPIEFPHGEGSSIGLALALRGRSDAGAHTGGKRPVLNQCSPRTVSLLGRGG